ncbi:MAG: hypothetical protein RL033_5801 [Pseudomonadota bacterium]|jgi:hypothetical protein
MKTSSTSSKSSSPSPSGRSFPLGKVKGQFEGKAKLVSAVQALATPALWLDRVSADKGLAKVSNAKLLRLHAVLSRAKQEFGSRDKLIGAVLSLGQRSGDEGYKSLLAGYPLPRLLDLHDSLNKASARKANAPKAAPAQRLVRTKKAKLKAAAGPRK